MSMLFRAVAVIGIGMVAADLVDGDVSVVVRTALWWLLVLWLIEVLRPMAS